MITHSRISYVVFSQNSHITRFDWQHGWWNLRQSVEIFIFIRNASGIRSICATVSHRDHELPPRIVRAHARVFDLFAMMMMVMMMTSHHWHPLLPVIGFTVQYPLSVPVARIG